MNIISLVLGAIVGALFSVVATVVFQDLISDFLISNLSWLRIRRSVDLAGDWEQDWQVDGNSQPVIHTNKRVILKQLGNRIYGSFFYSSREYMFRGRLESGGFLNGEWFDKETGPTYSGAFQLRINAVPKIMTGKWIGFSHCDPNKINSGPWKWNLVRKT